MNKHMQKLRACHKMTLKHIAQLQNICLRDTKALVSGSQHIPYYVGSFGKIVYGRPLYLWQDGTLRSIPDSPLKFIWVIYYYIHHFCGALKCKGFK